MWLFVISLAAAVHAGTVSWFVNGPYDLRQPETKW
jgi:hypothetical protein